MIPDRTLEHYLAEPFAAYAYAYPHKTAYRSLAPPRPLAAVWQDEPRSSLFGYVHIPFCSYRCGFCNLFALGAPRAQLVEDFLAALQRQAAVTGAALGQHRFARFAIGGGTPSYLGAAQFESLVEALSRALQVEFGTIPFALEVAPDSATPDRLQAYRRAGVSRISMGVQSFVGTELDTLARPRQQDAVLRAVDAVRDLGFATLNLDLIYGIAGQSVASFMHSLDSTLSLQPEELYLYPLYVRPLTGLGRRQERAAPQPGPTDLRPQMYAAACARLQASGYQQQSLRMFRRIDAASSELPDYRCQDDGMVGLGCGARSYTRRLHYSDDYAVARSAVADLIADYARTSDAGFACVRHGFELDAGEQRRRYLIQSLLIWPGLDRSAYQLRFGSEVLDDFPALIELVQRGLATLDPALLALTAAGMASADALGPWLTSAAVQARMAEHVAR